MKRLFATLLVLLGALPALATDASAPALQPYTASYAVMWKGMTAGVIQLELKRTPDGQYVYSSRANASGIFHMFFSDEITQTSWFTVTDGQVRPLRYRGDDGSRSTEHDISFDFDWERGRATGVSEDKPVDTALEPGTQDAMSIQAAMLLDLLRDAKPASYRLLEKGNIKEYQYTPEGNARLKSALGEFDTLVYRSQRGNSKRVTRTWYAPTLGYIPLRAEQQRDGKREWYMEIRTLKRG